MLAQVDVLEDVWAAHLLDGDGLVDPRVSGAILCRAREQVQLAANLQWAMRRGAGRFLLVLPDRC